MDQHLLLDLEFWKCSKKLPISVLDPPSQNYQFQFLDTPRILLPLSELPVSVFRPPKILLPVLVLDPPNIVKGNGVVFENFTINNF